MIIFYHSYDSLKRLEKAIYQRPDGVDTTPDSYNEIISYDKNGNIVSLSRSGGVDGPDMTLQIDDLQYQYEADSNRLLKVTDLENCLQGFADDSDGTNDTDDDYHYDNYGNLA